MRNSLRTREGDASARELAREIFRTVFRRWKLPQTTEQSVGRALVQQARGSLRRSARESGNGAPESAQLWSGRDDPAVCRSQTLRNAGAADNRAQRGARGVQIVAPSSISAWLKSPGRSRGTSSVAAARNSLADKRGASSRRCSTRRTLPSTTGSRARNAMLATAPAVYSPMPGNARSPSACVRQLAVVPLARRCARRCAGCARGCNSRGPPSSSAHHRAAHRPVSARWGTAASSGRSTDVRSRHASAAA